MHDILVQNNFFDQPGSHGGSLSSGSYGLYLGQTGRTYSNATVRNNTSLSTMYIEATLPVSNVVVAGNLGEMPQYQCLGSSSGVSYSDNVWYSDNSTAAKCGSTDKPVRGGHAAIGFVNYAGFDLHVTPRSPALSSGETTQVAERDIDGDLRPRGYPSDAGADQRETAAIVLGRSLGEIQIGGAASSVAGFYGSGSTSHARIAPGGPVVEIHRYTRHGARLWVAYAAGTRRGRRYVESVLCDGRWVRRRGAGPWRRPADLWQRPISARLMVFASSMR